jgi:hypothetical protein
MQPWPVAARGVSVVSRGPATRGSSPYKANVVRVAPRAVRSHLLPARRHNHHALGDAIEQAELFVNLLTREGFEAGSSPWRISWRF